MSMRFSQIFIPLFHILTAIFLISCDNKPERIVISQGEVFTYDSTDDISDEVLKNQTWFQEGKCFVIIYGYDFNSENFTQNSINTLQQKYGLYEDGGLILPLIYPDDFQNGKKPSISLLKSKLTSKDVNGILILGAPEGTSSALSRITDSFENNVPYPVFSCFSQDDDVLGMEYQTNIVIDKAITAEIDGMLKTEEEQNIISGIDTFIDNTITLSLNLDGGLSKTADLFEYAKKIGNPHKVTRYADPDTGLYSINHFYIQ